MRDLCIVSNNAPYIMDRIQCAQRSHKGYKGSMGIEKVDCAQAPYKHHTRDIKGIWDISVVRDIKHVRNAKHITNRGGVKI